MTDQTRDLPLFAWSPPCMVIAFPMINRVGKIRDVAGKMLDKTTDRHAEHYRNQVTEAIVRNLEKIGLSNNDIESQLTEFWDSVQSEMIRMTCRGSAGNNPKGAA